MLPAGFWKLRLKGREINFFVKSGTVVGAKVWSETHVSSYGGGGGTVYTNSFGVQTVDVRAPKVTSSVTTKRELWIRDEDGKEFCVKTNRSDAPANDGHDVSVVYAGFGNSGWPVCLVNRSTEYRYTLYGASDFIEDNLSSGFWVILKYISKILAYLVFPFSVWVLVGAGYNMIDKTPKGYHSPGDTVWLLLVIPFVIFLCRRWLSVKTSKKLSNKVAEIAHALA